MKKLSYYTIFSDFLNDNNDVIIFSSRSSEALLVTSKMKSFLEQGKIGNLPEKVIKELMDKKILVDFSENELKSIINENKKSIEESTVLYEVIQPTAYCQLGCDYCGQIHTKDYITKDLQKQLIARVEAKVKKKKWSKIIIGWFGGEPLVGLPQIRLLTKELKSIAEAKGIPYEAKVVTNGLSLKKDIFLELVNKLNVKRIEITLDGTAKFHDGVRHTKSGNPTFDIIIKNLEEIFSIKNYHELGCSISIRCNVDHRNWDGVSPLIRLLADKKFNEYISYFYPIGVYSWGGNDAHTKSLTKEEFAEKEIDWYIEMLEYGFTPNILPGRVKQVCIAVSKDSEMYDAFGNIYNCTEVSYTDFYDDTPYKLGNLKYEPSINLSNKPLNDWNDEIANNTDLPCHSCKMLPVCGGACPKSWHEDMRACPSNKFNIKEKLALAYIIANSNGDRSFFSIADSETALSN